MREEVSMDVKQLWLFEGFSLLDLGFNQVSLFRWPKTTAGVFKDYNGVDDPIDDDEPNPFLHFLFCKRLIAWQRGFKIDFAVRKRRNRNGLW